jgi:hypothetical protein
MLRAQSDTVTLPLALPLVSCAHPAHPLGNLPDLLSPFSPLPPIPSTSPSSPIMYRLPCHLSSFTIPLIHSLSFSVCPSLSVCIPPRASLSISLPLRTLSHHSLSDPTEAFRTPRWHYPVKGQGNHRLLDASPLSCQRLNIIAYRNLIGSKTENLTFVIQLCHTDSYHQVFRPRSSHVTHVLL